MLLLFRPILKTFKNPLQLKYIKESIKSLLQGIFTVELLICRTFVSERKLFLDFLSFASCVFQMSNTLKNWWLFVFEFKLHHNQSSISENITILMKFKFRRKRCLSSSDNKLIIRSIRIIRFYFFLINCSKNFNWLNIVVLNFNLDVIIRGKKSIAKVFKEVFLQVVDFCRTEIVKTSHLDELLTHFWSKTIRNPNNGCMDMSFFNFCDKFLWHLNLIILNIGEHDHPVFKHFWFYNLLIL